MKRLLILLALVASLPLAGSAETTVGTPINALPATLSKAGVYYVAKNLNFTATSGVAINITVSGVTLDLNAHEILASSGSGNLATAIFCNGHNRITIKDGLIGGFRTGVRLIAGDSRVTDLLITNCYGTGIGIQGDYLQVLHNRVLSTGGASDPTFASAVGINLTGTFGTVSDNDVQDTYATDVTGHYGNGIRLKDCSHFVLGSNRVLDTEPAAPTNGSSAGIATVSSDNLVMLGNTVITAQTGFDLSGATSGKYGDDVTSDVAAGYNTTGSGMVSIGNDN